MDIFGERIRQMRKKANISQEELAKRVGTTKQGISKIECGKTKFIKDDMLKRFAHTLNCTPDYLLNLSDKELINRENMIEPISFDVQFDLKKRLIDGFIKDEELAELFLQCNDKMSKNELIILKKIIRGILND